MHEGEVIRTADQVLGTYLFYTAAFRERTLDLGALLRRFILSHRHRVVDVLNPVIEAFDADLVVEVPRSTHRLRLVRI